MNHVYANLGGDILYIGPFGRAFGLNGLWEWNEERASPYVVADLEKVTHIVLHLSMYDHYNRFNYGMGGRGDPQLRTDLARFKNLKKVSLSCGRELSTPPWTNCH
jgi:hypothetical protein